MKNFLANLWIIIIVLCIILYPIFTNFYIQLGLCICLVGCMIYGGYIGIQNFNNIEKDDEDLQRTDYDEDCE